MSAPDNIDGGINLVPAYQGPAPPAKTGLHRYCFLVYAQHGALANAKLKLVDDHSRGKWDVVPDKALASK